MSNLIVSLLLAAMAAGAAQPERTTHVVGRVLDAKTKEPLVGATVVLQPTGPAALPPLFGALDAQTDEGGAFSLDVPSGRYRINVNQPGFVGGNTDLTSPLMRSISGRTVNLGNIRLKRGGAIEGRVFTENGAPMPGVSVSVVPPGLNIMRRNEVGIPVGSSAQTNDLGAFRVSGVPAGKYYVIAQPASRSLFTRQALADVTFVNTYYPGSASLAAARLVEVAAGNTTNGIEFRMRETATVTISGLVVDKRGGPVGGARVSFLPAGNRLARPVAATAQGDGTFTVALPDGKYRVQASRPVVVSQTANSTSVRFESGSKSMNVKVEGRPISGIRVVADR